MKKARQLVEDQLHLTTKTAQYANFQGMFSKTIIITLKEPHQKAVIQFRYEPLDVEPFIRARALMGELVPTVQKLHDDELEAAGLWPIYLSYIPGVTWNRSPKRSRPEFNVAVMKSLGQKLSLCHMESGNSTAVVANYVIPRLQKLLASKDEVIKAFQKPISNLLTKVHELEKLHLFCSHLDLNQMNIMVLENGEVSGIIDWELSPPPTPFGMGLNRIHDLAGQYSRGVFTNVRNTRLWSEFSGKK